MDNKAKIILKEIREALVCMNCGGKPKSKTIDRGYGVYSYYEEWIPCGRLFCSNCKREKKLAEQRAKYR